MGSITFDRAAILKYRETHTQQQTAAKFGCSVKTIWAIERDIRWAAQVKPKRKPFQHKAQHLAASRLRQSVAPVIADPGPIDPSEDLWIFNHKAFPVSTEPMAPVSVPEYLKRYVRGCVYIIQGGDAPRYKIGFTSNLYSRFSALQSASPIQLQIRGVCERDDYEQFEAALHLRLSRYRVHGEWFYLTSARLGWLFEVFTGARSINTAVPDDPAR